MKKYALIKAIHSYIPGKKLTNEQLASEYPDWLIEKIYNKTGIYERGIADKSECSSDLGVKAAKGLFKTKIIKPKLGDSAGVYGAALL